MMLLAHIFYVKVKDFIHEGWGKGDDHSVTPRLAKRPYNDHPDCPSNFNRFFVVKNVFEQAILPVTEHVPDKWQDFSLQLFLTDCRIKCAVFKDKLSLLNRTYSQSLFQS